MPVAAGHLFFNGSHTRSGVVDHLGIRPEVRQRSRHGRRVPGRRILSLVRMKNMSDSRKWRNGGIGRREDAVSVHLRLGFHERASIGRPHGRYDPVPARRCRYVTSPCPCVCRAGGRWCGPVAIVGRSSSFEAGRVQGEEWPKFVACYRDRGVDSSSCIVCRRRGREPSPRFDARVSVGLHPGERTGRIAEVVAPPRNAVRPAGRGGGASGSQLPPIPGEGNGMLRGGNTLESLTRIGAMRHIEVGT